jgi:hypothetical protein
MEAWRTALRGDPLPWLLDPVTPAVRHLALMQLMDEPPDAPEVRRAREAAMKAAPIAPVLAAQHHDGWWDKPGAGYGAKYTGTVWSLIFLGQMGADGADRRIHAGGEYVLDHSRAKIGGFGASGRLDGPPSTSQVLHCLNGNLLRATIGFGFLDDPRVRRAIDWETAAVLDEDFEGFRSSGTSGPGFACGVNEQLPCGWGAAKALLGLAAIPPRRRSATVRRAIEAGVGFLLSVDPGDAIYPMGWGNSRPNGSWFKLGFPSGYVADVLQVLEVLAELGHATDPRLARALDLVLAKQDASGRWRNENPYRGKLWVDVDEPRTPSKWVTLRACTVVKASLGRPS